MKTRSDSSKWAIGRLFQSARRKKPQTNVEVKSISAPLPIIEVKQEGELSDEELSNLRALQFPKPRSQKHVLPILNTSLQVRKVTPSDHEDPNNSISPDIVSQFTVDVDDVSHSTSRDVSSIEIDQMNTPNSYNIRALETPPTVYSMDFFNDGTKLEMANDSCEAISISNVNIETFKPSNGLQKMTPQRVPPQELYTNEIYRAEMLSLIEEHKYMMAKKQEEINHLKELLRQERSFTRNFSISSRQTVIGSPSPSSPQQPSLAETIHSGSPIFRSKFLPIDIDLSPGLETPVDRDGYKTFNLGRASSHDMSEKLQGPISTRDFFKAGLESKSSATLYHTAFEDFQQSQVTSTRSSIGTLGSPKTNLTLVTEAEDSDNTFQFR